MPLQYGLILTTLCKYATHAAVGDVEWQALGLARAYACTFCTLIGHCQCVTTDLLLLKYLLLFVILFCPVCSGRTSRWSSVWFLDRDLLGTHRISRKSCTSNGRPPDSRVTSEFTSFRPLDFHHPLLLLGILSNSPTEHCQKPTCQPHFDRPMHCVVW